MDDPTGTFGGVDWATDAHAVRVVDARGTVLVEFDVTNTAAGLAELCQRLSDAGVALAAIGRPDGPVVDAVMGAGLGVVVVASPSVKALRNQLRAHLRVVFPGAVGLFRDLDSPISLRFLQWFPSATRAGWLSEKRLAAWLRANGYSGRTDPAELYARLTHAPAGLTGDEGDARGAVTLAYVAILTALRAQIDELDTRLDELLDAHIFRSLPRCATIRAATLLAEIGDCRARFPDVESLACLAGVAPSTRTSGRHRAVTFRFSSDKKLRDATCDFAGDSWRGNAWAEHRYRALRTAGKSHPHAERILACTWTHIIWRCWQDGTPYDPTKHGAHHRLTEATG